MYLTKLIPIVFVLLLAGCTGELKEQVKQLQNEIITLESSKEKLLKDSDLKSQEIAKLQVKVKEGETALESRQQSISALEQGLKVAQEKLHTSLESEKHLSQKIVEVSKDVEALKSQQDTVKATQAKLEETNKSLKEELDAAKVIAVEMEQLNQEATKSLEAKIASLTQALEESKAVVSRQKAEAKKAPEPPTEEFVRNALNESANQKSGGVIQMLSFRKLDGQAGVIRGVPVYGVEMETIIIFNQACIWKCTLEPYLKFDVAVAPANLQGWDQYNFMAQNPGMHMKRGEKARIKTTLLFEQSEKGWSVSKLSKRGEIERVQ